jgi:hypothetical protein
MNMQFEYDREIMIRNLYKTIHYNVHGQWNKSS